MIGIDETVRMGTILKPHGVCGEMVLTVPENLDWQENLDCLICRIDGILVPFFIESLREKSTTSMLVKFEGVDTVEDTARFIGLKVFLPRKYALEGQADDLEWDDFIGWTVVDSETGPLGSITAVDDSTANILFQIRNGEREYIIPANEEWISSVDE